jgi:hypothetical protein
MTTPPPPPQNLQPRIRILDTCDPLTEGSYEQPDSPWVGLDERGEIQSTGMGRLAALISGYMERRISGCSVLIGGDRGAGRTSMVLKVIERLRTRQDWRRAPKRPYDPMACLAFPRPLPIRVHGPTLFHAEKSPSRAALIHFAEALHRSLCDEFGEMLQAKAGMDPILQEKAAQYRLELETGPRSPRLRQIWASFSNNRSQLEPILPSPTAQSPSAPVPKDQAFRELVCLDTSIRLCQEIHLSRDGVLPSADPRFNTTPEKSSRSDDEMTSWVRRLADFTIRGGYLLNPLAGFIIAILVFGASFKEINHLPTSIVLALLSGISATVFLNLAASRNQAAYSANDATLTFLGRTLPVLLRRVEAAGLFPIIIVDELDKVDERPRHEKDSFLRQQIDNLARDLKYFVADQAFVCFLVPRRFYEEISHLSHTTTAERHSLDTFFTDRILVSYRPRELLQYLDRRLVMDSGDQTLEFLKHLYLFRAQGHLSDLQDCISSEQTPDRHVFFAPGVALVDVPSYRIQVYFQLVLEDVVEGNDTQNLLHQHPDLLEPLNQVLYNVARFWKDHARSFVAEDLFEGTSANVDDARINFKNLVDLLLSTLSEPPRQRPPVNLRPQAQQLWSFLINTPELASPLLQVHNPHSLERYYWQQYIDLSATTRLDDLDTPERPIFRSSWEKALALKDVRVLGELLADLGGITPFDLAVGVGLLDYCPPANLIWSEWRASPGFAESRELAELHQAIQRKPHDLRDAILFAILGTSIDKPTVSTADFNRLLQAFRPAGQIGWPHLAEALQQHQKDREEAALYSYDIRRSYKLMVDHEPGQVAAWAAEGRILLGRCRSLASFAR